ncbi:MAG: oligosaccharide flippase family protein [Ignavibacteria bacterium]
MFINVNFTAIQININTIKNKDIKIIFSGFGALSALQAINIIIPLISIPYAVRVIGADYFGLVNFAAAFAGFFMIAEDYGFNITANRDIARNRGDKNKCVEIYNSVLTAKIILFLVSAAVFSLMIFSFGEFSNYKSVYLVHLGTLAGTALFPQWFFKGMEKMTYIAVPGIIIKTLTVVLIFILVREKGDYLLYAVLLNAGNLVLGLAGAGIVVLKFRYSFIMPSLVSIKRVLTDGLDVFFSIICTSIYGYANTFILGLFTDYKIVGLYAAADKVITGVNGLISNLNESTYPRISSLLSADLKKGIELTKTSAGIIGAVSLFFSLLLFAFADLIVKIFFGEAFADAAVLIRIMSLIPFFVSLNNLFGVQTVLNRGYKKPFLGIIFVSLICFLCLSFILVPLLQAEGTSISIAATELLVLLLMAAYIKRKKLLSTD